MIDMNNFAAFGTALSNLKAMSGTIRHTDDVNAIIKLIEGRIDFLNGIPHSKLYEKEQGAALGELCTLRMMILTMCGDVDFDEGDDDEDADE